jgi:uncharacterized Zn finger protein (UPF0148 family)
MESKRQGRCQKCNTTLVPLYEFDGRLLCKVFLCYEEEVEKSTEKHIRDEEKLTEYRSLVAGTKCIPPSE